MIKNTRKIQNKIKNQQGLTLVEVMLAVAVGAFVMVGVFMLYKSTATSAKTSTAINDVTNMLSQATTLLDADPTAYTSLTDISNYDKNDPWGQAYKLTFDPSTNGGQFSLTVDSIPSKGACVKIAAAALSAVEDGSQTPSSLCTAGKNNDYSISGATLSFGVATN